MAFNFDVRCTLSHYSSTRQLVHAYRYLNAAEPAGGWERFCMESGVCGRRDGIRGMGIGIGRHVRVQSVCFSGHERACTEGQTKEIRQHTRIAVSSGT